jgi:hypothetical protein
MIAAAVDLGFRLICDIAENRRRNAKLKRGTLAGRMNWHDNPTVRLGCAHSALQRRSIMRHTAAAVAALATVLGTTLGATLLGTTLAAHAQGVTVGAAPSTEMVVTQPVEVDANGRIVEEQLPAFREYVVTERIPSYTVPQNIVIGAVLADEGITLYDVPQRFGATPYRYTVVNGETVLIEPRTRRIMQVVD